MLGYLPIGFAFGVLASSAGISPGEATAMSVLVFAVRRSWLQFNCWGVPPERLPW